MMAKISRKQRTASESAQRWLLWTATAIITCIAFETLAVTTAMPTVTTQLQGEHLFALANGIALAAQLITTAIAGQWIDAKGVKPALFIGLSMFALGLFICTASPTIEIFTIGRLVQGLGGGLCIVPLYVLVGRLVPSDTQPKFFAFFSAAWVVPSLVGPAISGFLVEQAHWRWATSPHVPCELADPTGQPETAVFGPTRARIPAAGSLRPTGKTKPASARGHDTIRFGREHIDLAAVSQLVDAAQTTAIAHALDRLAELLERPGRTAPAPRSMRRSRPCATASTPKAWRACRRTEGTRATSPGRDPSRSTPR